MIRPMTNHAVEMLALQYQEYLREISRRQLPVDDPEQASKRRRGARRPRRVADSVDPGDL